MKKIILIVLLLVINTSLTKATNPHKYVDSCGNIIIDSLKIYDSCSLPLIVNNTDCPRYGDNPSVKLKQLNLLKNRDAVAPKSEVHGLGEFLKPGNDSNRFKPTQFVKITGYIIEVKYGEKESCNCHSSNKYDLDYHIVVATDPNHTDKTQVMIWEVTRFNKDALAKLYNVSDPDPATQDKKLFKYIKSLVNNNVTVEGWLLFDVEHIPNAWTTNPNGSRIWRGTCWEVHSIKSIAKNN